MSSFFSKKYKDLVPYTPGEQPRDKKYIKLNTNESPFPPSKNVFRAVKNEAKNLQLYSDPESSRIRMALAKKYGVEKENVIVGNGSDEILNFAFMAFSDEDTPLVFPDISYGFYPVFAKVNNLPYEEKPLNEEFKISPDDYIKTGKTVVIANPNAPTGLALSKSDIEKIVLSNKDNIVIIDEAYVDFGAESAVPLIKKYKNLLVTQTFSKSRSMAGARLGFGIGSEEIIKDLNTLRYSTNPYNVNKMTEKAGYEALLSDDYYMKNCEIISQNRDFTIKQLRSLGFSVTDSKANFVFASHEKIDGKALYLALKERGILVRHFDKEKIQNYNRITIGTMKQMKKLIENIKEILEELK